METKLTNYQVVLKLSKRNYCKNGTVCLGYAKKSMDLFLYAACIFSYKNCMLAANNISGDDIKSLEDYAIMMQAKIIDPRFTQENSKKSSEDFLDPTNTQRWLTEEGFNKIAFYLSRFVSILEKYPDDFYKVDHINMMNTDFDCKDIIYSDDFQVITKNVSNT